MRMANMTTKLLIAFCFICFGLALKAQQTVSVTGGNATGSGGTVSYTVGQVVYTINSGSSGIINQGVQQPYEIFISPTEIKEAEGISLECSVFPNPASGFLKLKIENYKLENLSFQLYDMNGKLLKSQKVESDEISISMENILPSTYFLKVTDNNKEVKVFKIIKN